MLRANSKEVAKKIEVIYKAEKEAIVEMVTIAL
jgi:hypothetical protein